MSRRKRTQDPATFTLSDVRHIRYLVLCLGAVGIMMLLVTDPDSPLLVAGFITVVAVVPVAAIAVLRRIASKKEPPPDPPATLAGPAAPPK